MEEKNVNDEEVIRLIYPNFFPLYEQMNEENKKIARDAVGNLIEQFVSVIKLGKQDLAGRMFCKCGKELTGWKYDDFTESDYARCECGRTISVIWGRNEKTD